jgi:hypothetical protein
MFTGSTHPPATATEWDLVLGRAIEADPDTVNRTELPRLAP